MIESVIGKSFKSIHSKAEVDIAIADHGADTAFFATKC